MRKLLLLAAFLPVALFAQKVKWEHDTIYKDNAPWAIMVSTGGLVPTYSLRTLANEEVAIAKDDETVANKAANQSYLRVTFLGDGKIAHVEESLPVGKRLAKAFVESDVIKDNALNPQGETRFLAMYPQKMPVTNNPTTVVVINNGGASTAPNYTTVERNRYGVVMVMGNEITQSATTIGTCSSTSGAANGTIYTTVSFYLPNGVKCAEATFTGAASHTCTIVTMRDNAHNTIEVTNMAAKEKEIAEWLVKNYYL